MSEVKFPKGFFKDPINLLAFGLGSGCAPKAPGTFGTLAAIPFYLLMESLPATYYLLVCLLAFGLGVWFCGHASKVLGVHDHGGIVWDEFVGYWVAMFMAPSGWEWVAVGFVLFRLFDIWKPWPIKLVDQNVHGGFGIMIDDILAGVYASLVLQAIALLLQ